MTDRTLPATQSDTPATTADHDAVIRALSFFKERSGFFMLDRSLALRLRLGPWAASSEEQLRKSEVLFIVERERMLEPRPRSFFKQHG